MTDDTRGRRERAETIVQAINNQRNRIAGGYKIPSDEPGPVSLIDTTLADAERRGMERAAKICREMAVKEGFKNITGTDEEDISRKSTAWMMDQCAAEIRAKVKADQEMMR